MFWLGVLLGLFVGAFLGLCCGSLLAAVGRGEDLLAAALALEGKPKPSPLTGEPQES